MSEDLFEKIDALRRRGGSHEDCRKLAAVHSDEPETVLRDYAASKLEDGRRRGEVNLGEPESLIG